jgi:hypothetical protein
MAKKSRKTAARYSELSKTRKKKQKSKPSLQTQAATVSATQDAAEPKPARRPVVKQAPRAQAEHKRGLPSYDYVRADLKKIGVLAGAMILVLIILTFVLG